ncbi:cholinesterase 2-like [Octopus vulgaris]|uniref:Carboxylic ester hydrolase n=1 Tax=Octopus vulgaris TaxID=6645 RepID=A0AA36B4P2_OCTVU|nr:cholinesterase 2-like [Octopus vulgaris]
MEELKYILIISLFKIYAHAQDPIIDTTTGKINGSTISVQNFDLDVFLGIPFAKPPVGNLRFKRPEEIERWSGIKETKKYASSCEQPITDNSNDTADVDLWESNLSEDCLYLNIWAPTEARKTRSNLTTMIWIYGGGFISGSSAKDVLDGRWLAVSQNIIVASINYRLGPFGFLSLNDERAPGNMGLLDQNLAIKWIRDNIASFGGDPDKLTLFGQSAGAISVGMHVISPKSRNLFRNAIMMSGTPNTNNVFKTKEENIDRAKEMAAFLKCPTENDERMLNCFLKADAKKITVGQYQNFNELRGIPFSPIIDNYFLQKSPNEVLQSKTIKKDVLIGFVKNEGTFMLLLTNPQYFTPNGIAPINKSIAHKLMKNYLGAELSPAQLDSIFYVYGSHVYTSETQKYAYILDQVLGDNMFKCPGINFARVFSNHSNLYMYSFEFLSNSAPWPEGEGVSHTNDIYYVFSHEIFAKNYSSEDKYVSEMMSSYFANFSKSGNPNNGDCSDCSNDPWPKFTLENQKYLVIDKKPNMKTREISTYNSCDFWSDLFLRLKKRTCPVPSGSRNIWTFQGRLMTFFTPILLSLILF